MPEETVTELIESDKDFIDKHFMLVNKIWKSESKERKNEIMDMILKDSGLSVAQIEQLKYALKLGISNDDIFTLAKEKRELMEMKKYIEFRLLVEEKEQEQVKRERWKKIFGKVRGRFKKKNIFHDMKGQK